MKRIGVIAGIVMLASLVAFATDEAPKYETFLGYNFVRFPTNNGVVPSFNANGGDGQFVYNFTSQFGAVLDLGAVTKGTLGGNSIDTTVFNFLAGPRFTWHNHSRFTPFIQALFGGAYGTTSTQLTIPPGSPITVPPTFCPGCVVNPLDASTNTTTVPISARLVASATHFAMVAGGGLDIKFGKHISFRPIGVDYYQTRFPGILTSNQNHQNNFRYTAGVNFLFGAQ